MSATLTSASSSSSTANNSTVGIDNTTTTTTTTSPLLSSSSFSSFPNYHFSIPSLSSFQAESIRIETLAETLRVSPADFGRSIPDVIEEKLRSLYVGKLYSAEDMVKLSSRSSSSSTSSSMNSNQRKRSRSVLAASSSLPTNTGILIKNRYSTVTGIIIGIYNILHFDNANIAAGDGAIFMNVTFQVVLLYPQLNDIIEGRIRSCDERYGIKLVFMGYDDMYILPSQLPPNAVYSSANKSWTYPMNTQPAPTTTTTTTTNSSNGTKANSTKVSASTTNNAANDKQTVELRRGMTIHARVTNIISKIKNKDIFELLSINPNSTGIGVSSSSSVPSHHQHNLLPPIYTPAKVEDKGLSDSEFFDKKHIICGGFDGDGGHLPVLPNRENNLLWNFPPSHIGSNVPYSNGTIALVTSTDKKDPHHPYGSMNPSSLSSLLPVIPSWMSRLYPLLLRGGGAGSRLANINQHQLQDNLLSTNHHHSQTMNATTSASTQVPANSLSTTTTSTVSSSSTIGFLLQCSLQGKEVGIITPSPPSINLPVLTANNTNNNTSSKHGNDTTVVKFQIDSTNKELTKPTAVEEVTTLKTVTVTTTVESSNETNETKPKRSRSVTGSKHTAKEEDTEATEVRTTSSTGGRRTGSKI